MNQRILGKTGRSVSEIGLGTWQLGTRWGDPFNRDEAMKILETAYDTEIPCRLEVGTEGGHGFADGSGMCMAGWPERAIRWYESLQQLCVG